MLASKKSLGTFLIVLGTAGISYVYQALRYIPVVECPVVNTTLGSVQGYTTVSRNGQEYFAYLGIPYAQPPIDNLRFEPPQVAEPWDGIRQTVRFGSDCAHMGLILGFVESTNEDCLFLNVYTPARNLSNPSNQYAVMVYFYGGMFMEGKSSMYGPGYYMDEDIVLVTVNYRTGVFGFLNTGDHLVRGNMGLKDQTAALKWVQANIGVFGGKPDHVTIFGQSAGSASVHYHMLSPLSKGLFSKAIGQSGVALNPWAFNPNPKKQAFRLGGFLNCSRSTTQELVDCLKKAPVVDILATHREVLTVLRDPISVYTPSIEGVRDPEAFLIEHPIEALKAGRVAKVPWLTGVTSHEGLIASTMVIRNKSLTEGDLDQWKSLANYGLYYTSENEELTEEIKQYFFGPAQSVSDLGEELFFQNLTTLFSDRHFFMGFVRAISLHAEHAPTFAYYYNYTGQYTITHLLLSASTESFMLLQIATDFLTMWFQKVMFGIEPPNYGVCHVDDLFLTFELFWPVVSIYEQHADFELSRAMVKAWVGFAQSPNPRNDLTFDGVKWPEVNGKTVENIKYLIINNDGIDIKEAPFRDRLGFWNSRESRF